MPKYNKSQAIFSYDVPGGALTADHDGIESVSVEAARDNSQGGTLGSNQVKNTYTGKDGITGEIVIVKDNTTSSAYQDFITRFTDADYVGVSFTVRIDSPDSEIGSDRQDMEIKITGMTGDQHDANSADPARVTFAYGVDGSYTKSVIT